MRKVVDEFEWEGWIVSVEEEDGTKEIVLTAKGEEEASFWFSEEDFLEGSLEDFIKNRGKGYEIYSYTPKGGVTEYYLRKRRIKEMIGVDQWGREYRFDVSEVRDELNRMHSEICEVIEKLKERSDTEFFDEINALCDVLSEIENLKKLYF